MEYINITDNRVKYYLSKYWGIYFVSKRDILNPKETKLKGGRIQQE